MATPQSTALKHWMRIIKRWPIDRVRPENVSFQTLMQQRLQRSQQISNSDTAATKGKDALPARSWDETFEAKQANALYALLEDRFTKDNPMPKTLRNPASSPSYYDDLVKEMEEAPSRSWLTNLKQRIKGSLRFK